MDTWDAARKLAKKYRVDEETVHRAITAEADDFLADDAREKHGYA